MGCLGEKALTSIWGSRKALQEGSVSQETRKLNKRVKGLLRRNATLEQRCQGK